MIAAPTGHALPLRRLACARCGAAFDCGTGGRSGDCWCMDETTRMPLPDQEGEDCLCPACLRGMAPPEPGHAA
jgi:hypothetical protein